MTQVINEIRALGENEGSTIRSFSGCTMTNYQLRLPIELKLEGLLNIMTAKILFVLEKAGLSWPGGRAAATEAVHDMLGKHVSTFDTCGCSSVCDEQVSPSAWNPDPDQHLSSAAPADRERVQRYQLRIAHGDLDELAKGTAKYFLQSCGQGNSRYAYALLQALAEAVRSSLGPYLFQSQLCQQLEICHMAQPVDAWQTL